MKGERDAATASARRLQRDAERLGGEQQRLETERRRVAGEMEALERAHTSAVQQHEQDSAALARYEGALAQAQTISSQQCETLEETPLSTARTAYDYLSQFESELARDRAIGQLESCRKKTARRMKKLASSGPSDSQIKQAIIEDSISRTSGSCPCPYHAASNGSRCGRRSSYSKYGGEYVICYSGQVSSEMVEEYRAGLVQDPLLADRDDFVDPWTSASGDIPIPVEPPPVPPMSAELRAGSAELEAELQQIDAELAALATERSALVVKAGSVEREIVSIDQREQERRGQWRARAEQHAQNTQVAGVAIMISGIVGAGAGAYGFYESSVTQTALEREREAQALNEQIGIEADTTGLEELELRFERHEMLGVIGLSVGIPLVGLGLLMMVSGGKRKESLERVSLSAGQLQWRF